MGSKATELVPHYSKRGIHDKAFVNGAWICAKSSKTFEVTNPATDTVVASVPDMDESDVEDAIQAASAAFQSWKHTTGKVGRVMHTLLTPRTFSLLEFSHILGKISFASVLV